MPPVRSQHYTGPRNFSAQEHISDFLYSVIKKNRAFMPGKLTFQCKEAIIVFHVIMSQSTAGGYIITI